MIKKRKYKTPSLTVYGDIKTITKAIGKDPAKDSIIINGNLLNTPTDGGSGDIEVNS